LRVLDGGALAFKNDSASTDNGVTISSARLIRTTHSKSVTDSIIASSTADNLLAFVADSGATETMSAKGHLMHNYKLAKKGSHMIECADGVQYPVVGYGEIKGSAKLTNGSNSEVVFKDVLHVPELTESLLSLKKVRKDGCTVMMTPTDGVEALHQQPARELEARLRCFGKERYMLPER
jgi:hypothetical protein